MTEQYFGTKELYQVTLRANSPMNFGSRYIEAGEPVLYFNNLNISSIDERIRPVVAHGGWGNLGRVVWEDRNDMNFTINEGVISNVGMGLLFSSEMFNNGTEDITLLPFNEIIEPNDKGECRLKHIPSNKTKMFVFEYENNCIQRKVPYELIIKEKSFKKYAYVKIENPTCKNYIVDYYFMYGEQTLLYVLEKERFRGLFTLEGKFYTKDENTGINATNVLTMPKVRIMSNINLRMGERTDPTTSVFNIIALPQKTPESDNLLMKIVRLEKDLEED